MRGALLVEAGQRAAAAGALRRAMALATVPAERELLGARLAACTAPRVPADTGKKPHAE